MVFLYDGTYEGFLSAVFDAYALKTEPRDIISMERDYQEELGARHHHVETCDAKADRLMAGMKLNGGGIAGRTMTAFLSWVPDRELILYRYIVLGFRIKNAIHLKLDDDTVRAVNGMISLTEREKYKWKGFLRFSVLDNNLFYAEMSPECNVLTLIMPHFERRMGTTPFLVHDRTFKQVGLYDAREWVVRSSEGLTLPEFHADEKKYRYLWKLFYDTTAMEFRANDKQRRQVMPKRYRQHVTEMQEQTYAGAFDEQPIMIGGRKLLT